jgi:hypothetical protein
MKEEEKEKQKRKEEKEKEEKDEEKLMSAEEKVISNNMYNNWEMVIK